MAEDRYVPIGRFSVLTRLTVRALRLYDKLGLLTPARVDADTGYRYYALSQAAAAGSIRLLREMDMPLDDVKLAIADRTAVPRLLAQHRERLERRVADGERALLLLNSFKNGGTTMLTPIEVRDVAPVTGLTVELDTSLARIGHDLPAAYEQLFAQVERDGLQPAGPVFAAYTSQEFDPDDMKVVAGVPVSGNGASSRSFDGGRAVTTTYVGPYEGLGDAWTETWAWVTEHGHAARAVPLEIYRVGPMDTDPEHFETDIVIPIE
ncbi:MAG: MerR family transcriptional regulator [Actinobacteria bacterium]|nr:MerR family transcriptional regulator [Actinomycetota bacterium]MBV8479421.1 MerR family transcriptional regulator [Actinomycetota bacterium]